MKERSTSSMGLFRFYYVAGTSPLFVSTMIFRKNIIINTLRNTVKSSVLNLPKDYAPYEEQRKS